MGSVYAHGNDVIAQLLTTLGLLLDIVGALFIVKSFLWMSDEAIDAASDRTAAWAGGPERYHPRPALQRLLREGRRDARVGGVVLASGFALQLIALWIR